MIPNNVIVDSLRKRVTSRRRQGVNNTPIDHRNGRRLQFFPVGENDPWHRFARNAGQWTTNFQVREWNSEWWIDTGSRLSYNVTRRSSTDRISVTIFQRPIFPILLRRRWSGGGGYERWTFSATIGPRFFSAREPAAPRLDRRAVIIYRSPRVTGFSPGNWELCRYMANRIVNACRI